MPLVPVQVTFRNLAHDEALEQEIRDRVSWLEQFYAGIVSVHRYAVVTIHEAFDVARRRLGTSRGSSAEPSRLTGFRHTVR